MKVLHISGDYDAFNQNLVTKQITNEIKARVFVYTTRKKTVDFLYADNVNLYNSEIKLLRTPLFFRTRINRVAENFAAMYKNNHNFDVMHAHMLFSDGEIALRGLKEFGIPYVVAFRNTDMNSWYLWHIKKNRVSGYEILQSSSKIIFLGPAYKEKLLKKLPTHIAREIHSKCIQVPNGIDEYWHGNASKKPKVKPGNNIKLLSVGRIERNKNQTIVLETMKILHKAGYSVKYSNVGAYKDTKMVRELRSNVNVTLIPFVTKELLINHYRNSDIFILPSINESFGLVYAEAISQGVPIIYSRGQGFDGQFPEGEVGFAVDPQNPGEISRAVIKILNNYSNISQNCIRRSSQFTWDIISRKYIGIYSEIVSNKKQES